MCVGDRLMILVGTPPSSMTGSVDADAAVVSAAAVSAEDSVGTVSTVATVVSGAFVAAESDEESPQAMLVSASAIRAPMVSGLYMDGSSRSGGQVGTRWLDHREPPLPRGCGLRAVNQATGLVVTSTLYRCGTAPELHRSSLSSLQSG